MISLYYASESPNIGVARDLPVGYAFRLIGRKCRTLQIAGLPKSASTCPPLPGDFVHVEQRLGVVAQSHAYSEHRPKLRAHRVLRPTALIRHLDDLIAIRFVSVTPRVPGNELAMKIRMVSCVSIIQKEQISAVTQAQLDSVAKKLNTRPRQTLNWKTSAHILGASVSMTD
jgi:hypothetical protein